MVDVMTKCQECARLEKVLDWIGLASAVAMVVLLIMAVIDGKLQQKCTALLSFLSLVSLVVCFIMGCIYDAKLELHKRKFE